MDEADAAPYEALLDAYREYRFVEDASAVLQWDQYVTMPEESEHVKGKQLSAVRSLAHDRIADPEFETLLADVDEASLGEREHAVVREIRREHEGATGVPSEIEASLSELTTEAHSAWNEARDADDFGVFAPHLEGIVEAKQEYANAVDPDAAPYEVLVGDFVPELEYDTVERVLRTVREELVPLHDRIRESDVELNTDAVHGNYDEDEQLAVARDLLDALGFDWDRGRLDTFDMPGTFAVPSDARVCTWTEKSLYQTLCKTAHEGGHALYAQGLPEEEYGSPLGQDRGTVVQESQATFWENHVFGHRAFWDLFLPTVTDRFPDVDMNPRAAYESVAHVRERNPVWVEADELTAQIHILLRFEVERDLINGEITVEEVPEVWNDRAERYLDVRPESLEEGCLQDIHWSQGNVGYFPTYTLGNVLAAQTSAALQRDLGDIGELIRDGEVSAILEWNRENVYRHGRRYTTPELIRRMTGGPLSADAFVTYATEKYADLYDL